MVPVPVEIAVHTVQGRCWDFQTTGAKSNFAAKILFSQCGHGESNQLANNIDGTCAV